MIQFNLLPDVKVDYLKTKRISRLIMVGAIILAAVVVFATGSLYFQSSRQAGKLVELTDEANDIFRNIESTAILALSQGGDNTSTSSDINELLTIQSQLSALTDLHEQKVAVYRFQEYFEKIIPDGIIIDSIGFDFDGHEFSISGEAEAVAGKSSLANANKLIDTFRFTEYTLGDDASTKQLPFVASASNLSLQEGGGAIFTITGTFDPAIFDPQINNIVMTVPDIDSTHGDVETAPGGEDG